MKRNAILIPFLAICSLLVSCASTRTETPTTPIAVKDSSGTKVATFGSKHDDIEIRAAGSGTEVATAVAEPAPVQETREVAAAPVPALKTIYFDTNESTLSREGKAQLNNVAEWLKGHKASVRIEGFADHPGTEAYNMNLSRKRALTVREYLESQGATATRITVASFGEHPGTERKAVIRTQAE